MRLLLCATGTAYAPDGSFGVPHLVSLGSYVAAHSSVSVDILDLDWEQRLANPAPRRLFAREWDIVGISCYSSFDYLRAFYLGVEVRRLNPRVCLVVGGYHASARPSDFTGPESPFDHVVVGEGEQPLLRIVQAWQRGERLPERVLGPEIVPQLDDLPPLDWQLLARYLKAARAVRAQVTLSLSRGCPFQCAFCMEPAKGTPGWRAYSPARAESELQRLHAALDLTDRSLFLTDPLFGLRSSWRREMLQRLQRLHLPVSKVWALTRADVIRPEDIDAFHACHFGLGFGLESGDPNMLAIVHKSGDAHEYLAKFRQIVQRAGQVGLPWGANLIAGHPGETAETLRISAHNVAQIYRDPLARTGFLSIDPYRYYPGSIIDRDLPQFERRFGTHVHRPRWWDASEPGFCASWVDPSASLDFRSRETLTHALFSPLVDEVAANFSYHGPARDDFLRALKHQQTLFEAPTRLATIGDHTIWQRLTRKSQLDARQDPEAVALLRQERQKVSAQLTQRFQGSDALARALIDVPREQFVDESQMPWSAVDRTLKLLPDGSATISALHAYVHNFKLLDLQAGDRLLELGSGSGYGAALAAHIVGPEGQVRTVEAEATLVARARENLKHLANAQVLQAGDDFAQFLGEAHKVLFTFALAEPPHALLALLPLGGVLVAPIGTQQQVLARFERRPQGLVVTRHGAVRYVADRRGPDGGAARHGRK